MSNNNIAKKIIVPGEKGPEAVNIEKVLVNDKPVFDNGGGHNQASDAADEDIYDPSQKFEEGFNKGGNDYRDQAVGEAFNDRYSSRSGRSEIYYTNEENDKIADYRTEGKEDELYFGDKVTAAPKQGYDKENVKKMGGSQADMESE